MRWYRCKAKKLYPSIFVTYLKRLKRKK